MGKGRRPRKGFEAVDGDGQIKWDGDGRKKWAQRWKRHSQRSNEVSYVVTEVHGIAGSAGGVCSSQ